VHDRNKRREIERWLDRQADIMVDRGRGVTETEGDAGSWGTLQHFQ